MLVPKCPINNIPALAQILAWCRPVDKPLSEPRIAEILITFMLGTEIQHVQLIYLIYQHNQQTVEIESFSVSRFYQCAHVQ